MHEAYEECVPCPSKRLLEFGRAADVLPEEKCLQRRAAIQLGVAPFRLDMSSNDTLGDYERTIPGDARLARSFGAIINPSCALKHRCFPQRKYLPEC